MLGSKKDLNEYYPVLSSETYRIKEMKIESKSIEETEAKIFKTKPT